MIYYKNMATQRIVNIYKDLLSGFQGLVHCIVPAVILFYYNKLDETIFIFRYQLL